jgi:hypothetical protein
MFHNTLHVGVIGDVVTSLIATASEAGINISGYIR